jgi:hypothetical protein
VSHAAVNAALQEIVASVKASPAGMTGSDRVRGQTPARLPSYVVPAAALSAGVLGAAVLPEVEGRTKKARQRSARENLAKAQADFAREQGNAGRARIARYLEIRNPESSQIHWPVIEHLTPDYNPRNLINMLEFWAGQDKHPVTREPLGVASLTRNEVRRAAQRMIGVDVPPHRLTVPREGQDYVDAIHHPATRVRYTTYGPVTETPARLPVSTVARAVAEEPVAQRVIGAVGRILRSTKASPYGRAYGYGRAPRVRTPRLPRIPRLRATSGIPRPAADPFGAYGVRREAGVPRIPGIPRVRY